MALGLLIEWLEQQWSLASFSSNYSLSFMFFSRVLPFVVLIIVVRSFSCKPSRTNTKKYNLPPSPLLKLPIIGNLHQIVSSSSLPHHFLQALSKKYGPLMFLHFGQVPTLVVSSAAMAEEIMKTHDLVCSNRPDSSIPKRLMYDKDVAFAPYGEYWRQMRRICVLQLLSPKRVQSYRSVREEEIAFIIEKIKKGNSSLSSSTMSETTVDLSKTLALLTNDIICRVVFGKKYSVEEGGKRYREMMLEFAELLGVINVGEFIPWLAWLNSFNGINSRVEKNFRELDSFLERVIEDHVYKRKNKKKSSTECDDKDDKEEGNEDFVDVLLGIEEDSTIGVPFSKDNIKALVLDMFAAGTDTTYTVIEWAMAEIVRHPEVMKEVQKEVRSITKSGRQSKITEDNIQQMPYLRSIIKETFRMHPSVPLLVPRETTEAIKIDGYDIPAKTRIFVNAWAIGRDSESWDEPEKFRPERFLNEGSSIDFKGHDFQLIPFGAGRRGCPGIHLAMATVELALANLLNEFDWEMPNGERNEDLDMVEGTGLTIHKKSPLVLKARPHKS